MNRICCSLISVMLTFVTLPEIVYAKDFIFAPNVSLESNDLSAFGNDDDVDVTSGKAASQTLNAGDTITWDYNYKTTYEVESGDQADIEELRLQGATLGGGGNVQVSLQFSDANHQLIGMPYMFPIGGWGANNFLVSDEDDILGNLQGFIIGDFHLVVTQLTGTVEFTGAIFNWEARDIEAVTAVPEPATLFLVLCGLSFLALHGMKANQGTR